MSFQQLTLIGNVGQDPEMKYVSNGSAVTTFNCRLLRTRSRTQK